MALLLFMIYIKRFSRVTPMGSDICVLAEICEEKMDMELSHRDCDLRLLVGHSNMRRLLIEAIYCNEDNAVCTACTLHRMETAQYEEDIKTDDVGFLENTSDLSDAVESFLIARPVSPPPFQIP
ncbi:hypothetical protein FE257_002706 [Aspergillus nanangensis]|uniref:Uncharacterized protein n=1 Tax=Aspergillus nanangensis TaxID=2582783 RepID=A0AAD4CDJ4_ASPNN|nr:hypothetical protein FE257_002706 [Aspergillus nanangensis]